MDILLQHMTLSCSADYVTLIYLFVVRTEHFQLRAE